MTHPLEFLAFYNRLHSHTKFEYIGYSTQFDTWFVSKCRVAFFSNIYQNPDVRIINGVEGLDINLAKDKQLSVYKDKTEFYSNELSEVRNNIRSVKSKIQECIKMTTYKVLGQEIKMDEHTRNYLLIKLEEELINLESERERLSDNGYTVEVTTNKSNFKFLVK